MSTTYQQMLQDQPADGDIVFIRRFTRDAPVLARWDAANQQFTLSTIYALTIVGGTYAGGYIVNHLTNILGSGLQGYGFLDSGRFVGTIEQSPGVWLLAQTDLTANAYAGPTYAPPPIPRLALSFSIIGSPAWAGPTSMDITSSPPVALIIPAYVVQAWRPQ